METSRRSFLATSAVVGALTATPGIAKMLTPRDDRARLNALLAQPRPVIRNDTFILRDGQPVVIEAEGFEVTNCRFLWTIPPPDYGIRVIGPGIVRNVIADTGRRPPPHPGRFSMRVGA